MSTGSTMPSSITPAQVLQNIQNNMTALQRQWTVVNAQPDNPNKGTAIQYLSGQMRRLMAMQESIVAAARANGTDLNVNGPPPAQNGGMPPMSFAMSSPAMPMMSQASSQAPTPAPPTQGAAMRMPSPTSASSPASLPRFPPSMMQAPSTEEARRAPSPTTRTTPQAPQSQPQPQPPQASTSQPPTRDFTSVVHLFLTQRGMALPPDWAAPFVGPAAGGGAAAGETRSVDLQTLFAKVLSLGGSDQVFTIPNGWAMVAQQLGLAIGGPSSTPNAAIPVPSEVPGRLAAYYTQRLALFEKSWLAAQRRGPGAEAGMPAARVPPSADTAPEAMPPPSPTTATPTSGTPTQPSTSANPFASLDPAQVQMAVGQHMSQLQKLVTTGQMTPQMAMARYTSIQQAVQAYHAERASASPSSMPPPVSTSTEPAQPSPSPGPSMPTPVMPTNTPPSRPSPAQPEAARPAEVRRHEEVVAPPPIQTSSQVEPSPGPAGAAAPVPVPAPAATGPPPSSAAPAAPAKYKITYIPMHLDVTTQGGRDLDRLDRELAPRLAARARLRTVAELGTVDVYGLIMSLRSGLSSEIAYALNVLLILSAGVGAPSSFQLALAPCDPLLDALLDVLASQLPLLAPPVDVAWTSLRYADAIELALHDEGQLRTFVRRSASAAKEREAERCASMVQTILTILRNVATMPDNTTYLATHTRCVSMLMQIAYAALHDARWDGHNGSSAALAALTLREVLHSLKDVLTMVLGLVGPTLDLSQHAPEVTTTMLDMLRFFLLDAAEWERREGASPHVLERLAATTPSAQALLFQVPHHTRLALQVLSCLALPDPNRETLAQRTPAPVLLELAEHLVHLLPVHVPDFRRLTSVTRLEYTETAAFCLYHVVYLAPPSVKADIRALPGVPGILFRAAKHLLQSASDYTTNPYGLLCRRLIETLRTLQEGKDVLSEPPLLGMYWPPDEGSVAKTASDAVPMSLALGPHEAEAIMEWLARTANVDTGLASDLLALVRA
ncbi:hypothetical protein Malapachy_0024 [Malassezia pachydermatis]|uniref:ARID domain-containing protein n=1 Tax=Malassezia pachydermatis TaxID=77020 RepID=A0A0M8MJ62_9BASI|nr:hypothetical protein Malapachy_0024 [Malassezia pachydermatis]KOS13526.1 hypothetical protein Malapachy_0024 [Malassezia pachydermatis]